MNEYCEHTEPKEPTSVTDSPYFCQIKKTLKRKDCKCIASAPSFKNFVYAAERAVRCPLFTIDKREAKKALEAISAIS